MNQEKIGKFIAISRKNKNMTQEQLAEKLGVNSRTISRWENGNYMPDLSLLKSLSLELDISINELLSGEKITKEKYQDKLEENIINTIDYSNKTISRYINAISLSLILFGLFISLTASTIFPSESSWGAIYMGFGCIMVIIGIKRFIISFSFKKKLIILAVIFTIMMGTLIFIDYLNVKTYKESPRFRVDTLIKNDMIVYQGLFYNVYKCNNQDQFHIDKYKNIDNSYDYYKNKCNEKGGY